MYALEMYALNQFIKSENTRLYRRHELLSMAHLREIRRET